jgi:hypothetical protein
MEIGRGGSVFAGSKKAKRARAIGSSRKVPAVVGGKQKRWNDMI